MIVRTYIVSELPYVIVISLMLSFTAFLLINMFMNEKYYIKKIPNKTKKCESASQAVQKPPSALTIHELNHKITKAKYISN